jgi:hypothetical protein
MKQAPPDCLFTPPRAPGLRTIWAGKIVLPAAKTWLRTTRSVRGQGSGGRRDADIRPKAVPSSGLRDCFVIRLTPSTQARLQCAPCRPRFRPSGVVCPRSPRPPWAGLRRGSRAAGAKRSRKRPVIRECNDPGRRPGGRVRWGWLAGWPLNRNGPGRYCDGTTSHAVLLMLGLGRPRRSRRPRVRYPRSPFQP